MLSTEHEAIVRLFHERPVLAAELLTETLKIPLPDYDHAAVESGDLNQVTPTELRADSVIVFRKKQPDADPQPVLAVVLEVQRRRDADKRWSWPMYLISLRTRMRCPSILLVVCPDPAIAHWSQHPIELGHPGLTLTPLVAGPTEVPMILDPREAAEDPELAALSVITHADTPQGPDILNALLTAVHDLDPHKGALYADMVRAALPPKIWEHLENLMQTETREFLSDWARDNVAKGKAEGLAEGKAEGLAEGKAEGLAEGKAEAIFAVLSTRGLAVPDDVRAAISTCTEPDQLDAWIRAAVTVESARDLLDT
ncbi:hypothetical protein [Microtetraspora sp. NBRC 16547]|uniref:hypothetical protein n=1 Tax=Microtetraspora sp. NBRC 16547 TaxID=3030993 RepID=UPI0024A479EB|nr:hypothetical protein [Microtetraspora sp. NBRC 16547]GLX01166.1 hypothetical protein Misp02_52520 [Microtetraspora sp. NBRC 16547]